MERLTAARIQTVRDHMQLECEGDWDGVIATFAHPRYELYGAGTVFDGEAAVRATLPLHGYRFPIRPTRSLPSVLKATPCWLNSGSRARISDRCARRKARSLLPEKPFVCA